MRKLHVFLLNGIILTASSVIMRTISLWFNAWISERIGAEGMGLYTLVMSVYSLAVTVAIFGMNLACTRLVAEESALLNHKGVKYSVKQCVRFGIFFGILSGSAVFGFSGFIGNKILQNSQTVISLKAFGVCLPFLSVSAILNGYFTATGKIAKSSAVQFAELFTKIIATTIFLNLIFPKTIEFSCFSIVLGGTVAETLSCFYNTVIYIIEARRHKNTGTTNGITRRITKIAFPVALSSCLKSGLSTVKHILIPIQLRKSGMSSAQALSGYGIIQGMVMPVIMFPSAIILSFSSLILPEFSQLYAKRASEKINISISKTFKITLMFSIGITGIFIYYSDFLGQWIYKSAEAGYFIRLVAPVTAIMYLDFVTDSILKGLNQQVNVVKINIIDTVMCIILIYLILPAYSTAGYIFVIFVSEIVNGILSVGTLIHTAEFEFKFTNWILKPILAVFSSGLCVHLIKIANPFVSAGVFAFSYLIFLSALNCIREP